jgi:hypothetical protein
VAAQALQDELAAAQEAAAAAGARARQFQAEARRTEDALDKLRSQHERLRRDSSARCAISHPVTCCSPAALHMGVPCPDAGIQHLLSHSKSHLFSNSHPPLLPWYWPCLVALLCRVGGSEGELLRLRAEVAAKAAEVQEARQAEAEYAEECGRLGRDLAAERLRAKVGHSRGEGGGWWC